MAGPIGVGEFTADGENWNVIKSNGRASNPERKILESQTEIGDFSEIPKPGFIKVTVRPKANQDSSALANATALTCVLVERNGVTWYGSNLVQTGEAEHDTATGEVELMFEGGTVTRQAAA